MFLTWGCILLGMLEQGALGDIKSLEGDGKSGGAREEETRVGDFCAEIRGGNNSDRRSGLTLKLAERSSLGV